MYGLLSVDGCIWIGKGRECVCAGGKYKGVGVGARGGDGGVRTDRCNLVLLLRVLII